MHNNQYHTNHSRGRGSSGPFISNERKSRSREGFGGYATGNGDSERGRGSTSGGGHFHSTTQGRPLAQRTVTIEDVNADVNPRALAGFFKGCRTFEELKSLYHGQKDKHYFNYIHASACFSQAIKLYTQFQRHAHITVEELTVFRDKVPLYSEELNARTLANLANDAVRLLDYAQKNQLKDAEELAYNTLRCVFHSANNRGNLEDFKPQELSNLANDAVKVLDYAQKNQLKDAEELAYNTLRSVFHSANNRGNLEDFKPQELSNLANDAVKVLDYAQKNQLKDAEELAYNTLRSVFHSANNRGNLEDFKPQELSNLANDAVKVLDYAQKNQLKDAEELAYNTLRCVFEAVIFHSVNNRGDLQDFDPQHLSNLANAAVKALDYAQKKNLKDADELAYNTLRSVFHSANNRGNLENFTSQHLANLANDAVKVLDYAQKKQLKDVEELAYNTLRSVFEAVIFNSVDNRDNLEDFDAQALANLANGAVKVSDYAQKNQLKDAEELAYNTLRSVFEAVIFHSVKDRGNLQGFKSQALSNLANAAVKALDYAQNKNLKDAEALAHKTLRCVFEAVNNRGNLQDFKPQELSNLANALVQAGYWNDMTSELMIKIGDHVCQRDFGAFNLQNICNLAWSFAVGRQLSLIDNWLIQGLSQLNVQQFSELVIEGAQQLYMTFLRKALDDQVWNKTEPDAFLNIYFNKDLVQKILQEVNEEAAKRNLTISKLQKNVGRALGKSLPKGFSLEEEYYVKPYPVDFAIFKDEGNGKNRKLITFVEVNGPNHFMCNGGYNLVHKFKETLYKDMDYDIINIDYVEFGKLNKPKCRENFINEKLSRVFESNTEDIINIYNDINKIEELSNVNKGVLSITTKSKKKNIIDIIGIDSMDIKNPISKKQQVNKVSSSIKKRKVEDKTVISKAQSMNNKGKQRVELNEAPKIVVKNTPVKKVTMMETIGSYATSLPALALYLIFIMLSLNTLRHRDANNL